MEDAATNGDVGNVDAREWGSIIPRPGSGNGVRVRIGEVTVLI
jgi:hypothetical protein